MERFFVAAPAGYDYNNCGELTISGTDYVHATAVLRMKKGDRAELCNGSGLFCVATVTENDGRELFLHPQGWEPCKSEPLHMVTLFQCLPKGDKMELITQKCVELGVHALAPVLSDRCVALPKDNFEKKRERLQRIANEAAKQSKRGILPRVLPLKKLAELDFSAFETVILAYEEEKNASLKTVLRRGAGKNIAIIIGPEGGFCAKEAELLVQRGADVVSLGHRILRTETAGIAMLAQLSYEVEE
jgi:16S rRNA (uracil1498-N3)-methyltransferase